MKINKDFVIIVLGVGSTAFLLLMIFIFAIILNSCATNACIDPFTGKDVCTFHHNSRPEPSEEE